jgi:hypothetical protein
MKVYVYFNLHRKMYSIRALDGLHKGLVIAHASTVIIREASFRVSLAGQRRVVSTGHKTVHAGLVGELEALKGEWTGVKQSSPYCPSVEAYWTRTDGAYATFARNSGKRLSYNPHRGPWFTAEHAPDQWVRVNGAPMVLCELKASKSTMLYFDPCEASKPFPVN